MKKFLARAMVLIGGFFFLDGILCIPVAFTAGEMTFVQRMCVALVFIAIAVLGGRICWSGIKRLAKQKPETPQEVTAQPTAEQQRLHDIEENIDRQADAMQANPMSQDRTANEEAIKKPEHEKTGLLKEIAGDSAKITAQDALNTFLPEQQEKFSAQLYQYSQDTGRDGRTPEDAAEVRGLVFVDGKPTAREVAERLEEMRKAASFAETANTKIPQKGQTNSDGANKDKKKLSAIDYPVPFTKLLIYPNRVIQSKRPMKVLHADQSASYGTRFKDKVSLYDTNTPHELIWEHEEQSEHGAEYDREYTVHAWLSMKAERIHHIPLTHWILSLQSQKLQNYTDCVCITVNEKQTEGDWRSITLKESRNTSGHDQLGWNCMWDTITLRFHRNSTWSLCRNSIWREAPSGLPYAVFIEMNLLPGVEKEAHETLCAVMKSLPWNDPNAADAKMWEFRAWLDFDAVQQKIVSLSAQAQKNLQYEAALQEAKSQLRLLETKAYLHEIPKIKNWINILGKPGEHGDVMRIGFANGVCYLEVTNDGYPNRMASGGFVRVVPKHIVRGKRLDARKFEEFYRSIFPEGESLYYSHPIWIYTPTPGRPDGEIEVVKQLSETEHNDGAFFEFEKTVKKRDVVKVGEQYYLRVTDYHCTAEANGRPTYSLDEAYHRTDVAVLPLLTAESGLDFAEKAVAYRYTERGTGVLF